jgi:hypothetical protein
MFMGVKFTDLIIGLQRSSVFPINIGCEGFWVGTGHLNGHNSYQLSWQYVCTKLEIAFAQSLALVGEDRTEKRAFI